MNYNIKGTSLDITDEIRGYVEKKLSHLDKFLFAADGARADIELGYLSGEAKTYRAEFTVHDPGQEMRRAECRGSTLHEAIDGAISELSREMMQLKKKRLQVFRRSAVKVKEYLRGWRSKI